MTTFENGPYRENAPDSPEEKLEVRMPPHLAILFAACGGDPMRPLSNEGCNARKRSMLSRLRDRA